MSDPRFEEFKALLLDYSKVVETMESARNVGTMGEWNVAVRGECATRLALYDWATSALASPPAPAEGEREACAKRVEALRDRWRAIYGTGLRPGVVEALDAAANTVRAGEMTTPVDTWDAAPRPPSSPDPAPTHFFRCACGATEADPKHRPFPAPSPDPGARCGHNGPAGAICSKPPGHVGEHGGLDPEGELIWWPAPSPAAVAANPFALSPAELGDRAGLTAAEVQARVAPAAVEAAVAEWLSTPVDPNAPIKSPAAVEAPPLCECGHHHLRFGEFEVYDACEQMEECGCSTFAPAQPQTKEEP